MKNALVITSAMLGILFLLSITGQIFAVKRTADPDDGCVPIQQIRMLANSPESYLKQGSFYQLAYGQRTNQNKSKSVKVIIMVPTARYSYQQAIELGPRLIQRVDGIIQSNNNLGDKVCSYSSSLDNIKINSSHLSGTESISNPEAGIVILGEVRSA